MPNSDKIQCQDKWIYELKVDSLCPYLLLPMTYHRGSRSPPPPWHACGKHHASSVCDKHRRKRDDQRDADVNVKQDLIDRITAKLPADWHGDRPTLLETCKPPHLGSLNKNIQKDTPISICTFGIENFERLGRGEMIVKRDIQARVKGKSYDYDLRSSNTDKIIDSLERNHPEICSDRYIVLVDCRDYHDPDFGRDSYHLGWKDETLAGLIHNEKATRAIIDQILEGIKGPHGKNHRAKLANGLVIALMCKSGFHRSLVSAKCVRHVLEPVHNDVKEIHLSRGDWSTRGCQRRGVGRCPLCQDQSMTQLRQLALALYQKNFDEHLAKALDLIETERFLKESDAARRAADVGAYSTTASSSKAPPTVTNTTTIATPPNMPASKAMPKIVRPTSKWGASKSGKGSGSYIRKIHEPKLLPMAYRKRSRSPPRPNSAPSCAYIGAPWHACGNHRDSSACDVNHTSLGRHKENSPPQGKVVELIGRSSVEWRGGMWNDRLSELCMRAVERANITFHADEDRVLTELYERIFFFSQANGDGNVQTIWICRDHRRSD